MYRKPHWKCLVNYSAHFVAYSSFQKHAIPARFSSVFKAGEQVCIIFLDSQIFDEVLDIFPRLLNRLTFIMLNLGMVDNLELWQPIFEFRGPKHVFHSRDSRRHGRAELLLFFAFIRAFTIFLFKVSWICTSRLTLSIRICGDVIKDHKRKVDTNRLVSKIH